MKTMESKPLLLTDARQPTNSPKPQSRMDCEYFSVVRRPSTPSTEKPRARYGVSAPIFLACSLYLHYKNARVSPTMVEEKIAP